jgi:hypothetical protein
MDDRFGVRAAEDGGADRVAWERDGASFPGDLFDTWLQCMTRPVEFFGRLDPDVSFGRPLLFFLVFWILGSGLGTLSTEAVLGGWYAELYAGEGLEAPGPSWSLFLFFLSPFIGLVMLAIHVGLTHLGVRLFVPEPRPIGVTGRALCYVGAPQVVAIVPLLGWLVGPLWSLFLAVVAVQRVHATSTGRAVAAVIVLPFVFWFGLGMVFALFIAFLTVAVSGVA